MSKVSTSGIKSLRMAYIAPDDRLKGIPEVGYG